MIAYVDDLLLSGPAEHNAPFWAKIGKDVHIEPPEDLERYLGRHHYFSDYTDTTDENLLTSFNSSVDMSL